ncbi:tyrosine-protein kinase, partial [Klebsiella pneumoniae]|nr:tyrosine-protein kinase [Klebsiella pneumoniae]
SVGDFIINGKVGELLDERGISLKVDEISAKPGTEFSIVYVSRLKAITDLQDDIAVADQGKDTGMPTLSLTGDNPVLIERILNSISEN